MKDLSYSQILYLTQIIGPKLLGNYLLSFEEIESSKWLLHFSGPFFLLLSLKHPFIRFYLVEKKPQTHSTPFCKKIEKHLKDQTLCSFSLWNEDRILTLGFENGLSLLIELFSRGWNLYLLTKEKKILFSYVPIKKEIYSPPLKPKEHQLEIVDPAYLSQLDALYQKEEELFSFEKEKGELTQALFSRKKRLEKEAQKLKQKAPLYEKKMHLALLLKNHFSLLRKGLKEIELEDWQTHTQEHLTLNPSLTPKEQLNSFFQEAEKQKKEDKALEEKRKNVEESLFECQEFIKKSESLSSLQEVRSFRKAIPFLSQEKSKKTSEFLEFLSSSGKKIYVGRTDKENDRLTFSFAKGSDYWLHVSEDPGSHVIIRAEKGAQIDEKTLLDAAQLALFYSKAKESKESDIFITQRKFLSRIRGKPGQVQMSKHRKMFIRLDLQRIEELKKRLL
jgi:predicted ribosome quality control (RQC) complex YloA/Tae2 family protein